MTLAMGTVLSGRYEIVEKIGTGGMATVYRANDLKLDRSVTVKVLKEEYTSDDDFKARFKVEAKAAAKLSHPNIVNVYDVGEDNGVYYIVMEYVHGDTLKQVILNSAPFDNVVTLSIAVQMASALSHAHKNGVVHRDIKPHNILVGVDGTIKITDFGIARSATVNTATTTNNALGSVYYLSPEQARGGYVDAKSDIYSLGITMYEMATGRVPYDGDTSVAIALKHLNNDLPNITQYNPDVSPVLQQIIKKATEKKKDDRYASVDLMLEDLKQAISEVGHNYKKEHQKDDALISEQPKAITLGEAAAAAATIGVSRAAQKGVEEAENGSEIKLELTNGRKDTEDTEKSEGFDMHNKKLKISKDDDDFENDVYRERKAKKVQPRQASSRQSQASGRSVSQRTKKPARQQPYDDDEYYKEKERKVTIAAIITAIVIIIVISIFGAKFIGGGGSKAETSSMPSVLGYTVEEAQKSVKKAGLKINASDEQYSNEYKKDTICLQEIEEGASVSKGDVINVTVSLGSKSFTMPNVVYDKEDEAVAKIKKLGGTTPETEYAFDDTVPVGTVIEQKPAAQSQINSGTAITLKISKGAETLTVVVPDFKGMKLGDAQKLMAEKGLLVGKITENNNVDGEKDNILSQSLTNGQEVSRDTKIDFVVVGSKVGEAETEEPTTPPTQTAPPNTETPAAKSGTKSFSISAPTNVLDQNNISVKVLKITNGSTVDVVFNEAKTINDFPFNVSVSGTGQAEIQLYIDNVYQWSQNVNLAEGVN